MLNAGLDIELADSLFNFDPDISVTATDVQNAAAIAARITANLAACGTVSTSGAVVTVNFGAPPGCKLISKLLVSGTVTATVSHTASAVTVVIVLTNVTVNSRALVGPLTFTTTNGSNFVFTKTTGGTAANLMVSPPSVGSFLANGLIAIPANPVDLTSVVWKLGDCYPNAGAIAFKHAGVSATLTFSPATVTTGVA
jgi:hypothetical protein